MLSLFGGTQKEARQEVPLITPTDQVSKHRLCAIHSKSLNDDLDRGILSREWKGTAAKQAPSDLVENDCLCSSTCEILGEICRRETVYL